MFKHFKNDKITKLVGKARTKVNEEMRKNEINFLEAHLNLEKEINIIYDSNNFSYQDLIKRKKHLTVITDNINNISISLVFGLFASVIFEIIKSTVPGITFINHDNNSFMILVSTIFTTIFFICIGFGIVYLILNFSYQFSSNDKLHTNDYELEIIKNKLKAIEDDYRKENHD